MTYVDGFVIPVPVANKQAYIEFAELCGPYFKKHGALSLIECWGDDVPEGETTSFHMAVKRKPDEGVLFSWIIWPDKATRNSAMDKIVADMEADGHSPHDVPFDGARMIYGGFEKIIDIS